MTYDELYTYFLNNCLIDRLFLPNSNEKIYELIRSSVKSFNGRVGRNLSCDDVSETIIGTVTELDSNILIQYMKIQCLKNVLIYKNSMFTTFTKEIGVRNINGQIASLKSQIEEERLELERMIFGSGYYDD